jgi:hypothetical protein
MLRAALFFLLCLHKLVWGGVVYSVGNQEDPNNLLSALLWITDVETGNTTTVTLDDNASASGIASLGNQLFIIGTGNLDSETDTSASLWITSLQGANKKNLPLSSSPSEAFSIIAYKNRLFVTGQQNNTATLWILNRDGSIFKTAPLELSEGYDISEGRSLAISNNQLFITGFQYNSTSNATLWILDTEGNPSNTIVFVESSSNSEGNSIEVNNNKLYITGYKAESVFHATLWINSLDGQELSTTKLDSSDENSVGISLAFFNNRIYVAGYLISSTPPFNARLWIRELDGANYKTVDLASDDIDTQARSVKPFKNLILVGGASRSEAVIWVLKPDGSLSKTIPLGLSNAVASNINAIYVPDENPKTLNNAFKAFSPFKYQKGV